MTTAVPHVQRKEFSEIGANLFLDTMMYLHFVPIEQVDFCSLLGVEVVRILVPRVTFRELEKHKIGHTSTRIRDRSRQGLAFLEKHIKSGLPIRDGVSLEFIPHMPRLDMEQYGLNPGWNDDVLIASVLEYKTQKPSEQTLLVTDDGGARLTCHHLGVRTFELPEKYRLPIELDETEKENQRLRREIQRFQNALPKITIGFGDNLESIARFSLGVPEEIDESLIRTTLSKLRIAIPELQNQDSSLAPWDQSLTALATRLAAANILDQIAQGEFERYDKERLAYFDDYERYMRAMVPAHNRMKRTLRFTIAISNTGSAPAEDVDVRLSFPDGFTLHSKADLPALPKEPEKPVKPRSQAQLFQASVSASTFRLVDPIIPFVPGFKPPSTFKLRKTNSYEVSDHFARIKHGQTEKLRQLFLIFDSHEDARSFHCDYEISVGNLPDALRGRLHFVIDREGAPNDRTDP